MLCETAAWTMSQSDLVSAAGSRAAQVSRLHNSPKHADVSEWGIFAPYMFYFVRIFSTVSSTHHFALAETAYSTPGSHGAAPSCRIAWAIERPE